MQKQWSGTGLNSKLFDKFKITNFHSVNFHGSKCTCASLPKVWVVSGQTVGFCTAQTDWKKPGWFSQVQPGKNRQFSQARLRILTGSPLEFNTTRCDRLKRAQINQLFHHVFISELFGRFQDQTNCTIHLSNACLNKISKIF
jgi:hypothetical protein